MSFCSCESDAKTKFTWIDFSCDGKQAALSTAGQNVADLAAAAQDAIGNDKSAGAVIHKTLNIFFGLKIGDGVVVAHNYGKIAKLFGGDGENTGYSLYCDGSAFEFVTKYQEDDNEHRNGDPLEGKDKKQYATDLSKNAWFTTLAKPIAGPSATAGRRRRAIEARMVDFATRVAGAPTALMKRAASLSRNDTPNTLAASDSTKSGASVLFATVSGHTLTQTLEPTTYAEWSMLTAPTTVATQDSNNKPVSITIRSGGVGWQIPTLTPGKLQVPEPNVLSSGRNSLCLGKSFDQNTTAGTDSGSISTDVGGKGPATTAQGTGAKTPVTTGGPTQQFTPLPNEPATMAGRPNQSTGESVAPPTSDRQASASLKSKGGIQTGV
ncbi:MAG: hypothetical protein Q9167_002875 [Letrouitia subvulpina]